MSVTIPYSFVGGTKARAAEVNSDFQAIAAKFTEGAGGIGDADISTTAGIKGSKLSSVPGNRITQAQMDDDAVDSRVLKDDGTAGSPNAAVGSANHIKDAIITNAKLVDGTIKKGKANLTSVTVTIPVLANQGIADVSTGLTSSAHLPIFFHSEASGVGATTTVVTLRFHLDTSTGGYNIKAYNNTGISSTSFTVRIWAWVI